MQILNSNRNRFFALIIGAVLFFPIVWKLAVRKTVMAYRQKKELSVKLLSLEDAPHQIAYIEKKLDNLNKRLLGSTDEDMQNHVLDEISILCKRKDLYLTNMPPTFRDVDNNYLVETINVQITGSFHKLLELMFELEKPQMGMNIVSANFYIKENKRLKSKQLILSLYIQALKIKN